MPLERQPWDGVEHRKKNAGIGITSLKIATRVAESTPLGAEQMFQDSGKPEQNNVRQEDFGNQKLHGRVATLLRTAVINDIEIADCVNELVDTQYQGSLDTLKTFNLYNPEQPQEGDVPAPTLAQAKEILTSQITPEQLEVIKRMKKPALQLIPVTSMSRYAEALDSHKPMKRQANALVLGWYKKAFARADKRDGVSDNKSIIGWKIAITEGAEEPELLDGDDGSKTLGERAAWFKREFGKKGVSGVDLKRMLILMMESLKNNKPINNYVERNGTSTFVNEEPGEDGAVSNVAWRNNLYLVYLFESKAVDPNYYARFRTSIIIDVPSSGPSRGLN